MPAPLFSLLLHLENGVESSLATLTSVAKNTPASIEYDTLILDDATSDATQQLTAQLSGTVEILRSETRIGQAAAIARLAEAASAPFVLIVRQGATLEPGWHEPLFEVMEDPDVVAAQALIVADDSVLSAGLDLTDDHRPIVRWLGQTVLDDLAPIEAIDAVDGLCAVVRTDALRMSGGLDPSYPAGAMSFADLSRRLATRGQKLVVASRSHVRFATELDVQSGVTRFKRLAPPEASRTSRPRTTTIALYLPAFHRIPQNDRWWGEGFTEWTNVVKAQPLFEGHEQPHLPADLGLYDLRVPSTRAAQAELAERFGIGAFCYYHYWFHGRRLLEQPFEAVHESGTPALPFCLCWANEDWRANWDGYSGEMLMEQRYSAEDDIEHIRWLCHVFRDRRYLRVNGKPIFLIYRASQLPDVASTLSRWRQEAEDQGIGELFLCRVESFDDERDDPRVHGFDASIEFQPDWIELGRIPSATGPARAIYDYQTFTRHMLGKPKPDWRRIPCVTPSWDNTARRGRDATVLVRSTPRIYRAWAEAVSRREERDHPDSPLLFVNAWNEWGEGAHLEPDSRWGTGYLEANRDATRATGRTFAQDTALAISGLDFAAVAAAAAWLHSCGLAIDSQHPARPDSEQIGDSFSDVNSASISRTYGDSYGWRVTGQDDLCWFSVPELERARSAIQARRRSHPQWGWADPRTVMVLEAWADLILDMRTLLLWSPLQTVVGDLVRATAATPHPLDAAAAALIWGAYNRRVLAYRSLYPDRCVLAPVSALSERPEELLALLEHKLEIALDHRSPDFDGARSSGQLQDSSASTPTVGDLEQALSSLSDL